jgi:hypothetical protein
MLAQLAVEQVNHADLVPPYWLVAAASFSKNTEYGMLDSAYKNI